jgi:hypothetical protein
MGWLPKFRVILWSAMTVVTRQNINVSNPDSVKEEGTKGRERERKELVFL